MLVYPDKIANIVIDGLRATMKQKDRNATGRTRDSLYYNWNGSKKELLIIGPDHFRYVDQGREPGKMPPLDRIIEWCIARSIPQELAFPIARSIAKKGAPKDKNKINVVSETLTAIMPDITKEVGEQVNERFKATINPLWSKPIQ